jgi:WD40 repeat protein
MYKRSLVDEDNSGDQKRFRVEDGGSDSSSALVAVTGSTALTISQIGKKKEKVSILEAPNVLLTGHTDAVYSLSFDPSGHYLASASRDRQICKLMFTCLISYLKFILNLVLSCYSAMGYVR